MSEIRIRVKPNVKEMLEANKEKYGFSINFQVNFAIFKYLALDTNVPLWKLDDRPDPHYETINKIPEDFKEDNETLKRKYPVLKPNEAYKHCYVDSCEILSDWMKKRGDKC